MKNPLAIVALSLTLSIVAPGRHASASGPLGIFGIIERVHFYPDEANADRIQMWGAFSYQGCPDGRFETRAAMPRASLTEPQRGYLYFARPAKAGDREFEQLKREWLYIKSVAGTGQAIGFGTGLCGYRMEPRPRSSTGGRLYISDGQQLGIRVRPDTEPLSAPANYPINIGALPLNNDGTQADLVQRLRAALRK